MTTSRRLRYSWALERAVEWATHLGRPLVILEALRCDYRWASDRLHRFVLDGMLDNLRRLSGCAVTYHPYVEPSKGHGRGLLQAWATRAAVVITDDFPTFFIPAMIRAAARQLDVRLEVIDGNGLLPMAAIDSAQGTAVAFRRRLQRQLLSHIEQYPLEQPIQTGAAAGAPPIPDSIGSRWPPATEAELEPGGPLLQSLPVNHAVAATTTKGGATAAGAALDSFLANGLSRYAKARARPDEQVTSGLSPYLHFGHIGAHEVFSRVMSAAGWSPACVARQARGQRQGWWGADEPVEEFLDQLITWRELGLNTCHHLDRPERYETLPGWARETLAVHAGDTRPYLYDLEQLDAAQTHDPLWNACQHQLVREGRVHGYLRMLWGKKILEWSAEPMEALETMLELNNRYALDGRDPSSIAGITWVLGRYDRGWPERAIYGKVRSMSSRNTARKVPVKRYLERYS